MKLLTAIVRGFLMAVAALVVAFILMAAQEAYWRLWVIDIEVFEQWAELFEWWAWMIFYVGLLVAFVWGVVSSTTPPMHGQYRSLRLLWGFLFVPPAVVSIVATLAVFAFPSMFWGGLVEAAHAAPPRYMAIVNPYILDAVVPYYVASVLLSPKKFRHVPISPR